MIINYYFNLKRINLQTNNECFKWLRFKKLRIFDFIIKRKKCIIAYWVKKNFWYKWEFIEKVIEFK